MGFFDGDNYKNNKWIEYLYFNLYFNKNPNKKVNNIDYEFQYDNRDTEEEKNEQYVVNKEKKEDEKKEDEKKEDEKRLISKLPNCKELNRIGFKNPDIMCYIITVLQLLYSVNEVKQLIYNFPGQENIYVNILSKIFKLLDAKNKDKLDENVKKEEVYTYLALLILPEKDRSELNELPSTERNKDLRIRQLMSKQQDCSEIIIQLIDKIEGMEDIFKAEYINTITCKDDVAITREVSRVNEKIFIIYLNRIEKKITNLQTYLNGYQIQGDELNSWSYDTGKQCIAEQTTKISPKSNYFIISLIRYDSHKENAPFIQTPLVPDKKIKLGEVSLILVGCICFEGIIRDAGHYIFYNFCDSDGKLGSVYYNDDVVKNVNYRDAINMCSTKGVLFLYKKMLEEEGVETKGVETKGVEEEGVETKVEEDQVKGGFRHRYTQKKMKSKKFTRKSNNINKNKNKKTKNYKKKYKKKNYTRNGNKKYKQYGSGGNDDVDADADDPPRFFSRSESIVNGQNIQKVNILDLILENIKQLANDSSINKDELKEQLKNIDIEINNYLDYIFKHDPGYEQKIWDLKHDIASNYNTENNKLIINFLNRVDINFMKKTISELKKTRSKSRQGEERLPDSNYIDDGDDDGDDIKQLKTHVEESEKLLEEEEGKEGQGEEGQGVTLYDNNGEGTRRENRNTRSNREGKGVKDDDDEEGEGQEAVTEGQKVLEIVSSSKEKDQNLFFYISSEFSLFRNTAYLVDLYKQIEGNDNTTIYNVFLNNYGELLEESRGEGLPTTDKVADFIYVYILLSCYLEAENQSNKEEGPFNIDDWWFFSRSQFTDIKNEINIKEVMKTYNDKYGKKEEVAAVAPTPTTTTAEREGEVAEGPDVAPTGPVEEAPVVAADQ